VRVFIDWEHADELGGHGVHCANGVGVGVNVIFGHGGDVVVFDLVSGAAESAEGPEGVAWRWFGELSGDGFLDGVVPALAGCTRARCSCRHTFRGP
jgi:hypothetical protein